MSLSEGKVRHMKALSNKNGVISAAAMDQRGSLQKAIAKGKGIPMEQVTPEMMSELKYRSRRYSRRMRARFCSIRSLDFPPRRRVPRMRACCWRTKRPATTTQNPGGCQTCYLTSPPSASWIGAPMPSRF